MRGLLVVVPCGQGKVWDRKPAAGLTPAGNAYTGAPFKVNREYAERFAERWVILSAKYGFVPPECLIAPYNVTFKKPSTSPVGVSFLRLQIQELGLDRYEMVVGLGGKDYQAAVQEAFAGTTVRLVFPFAGLRIGKAMQATKAAIATEDAFNSGGSS